MSEQDAATARQADVELARAVTSGDATAQGKLLDRVLPHLRAVARAILNNGADADDAVQVALMRVLKGLPGYRGQSTLVRWSRRVAAHACLRLKQDNQRRLRVVELATHSAQPGQYPVRQPDPDLPGHVERYLRALPEVQREALVLRHVLGHTVREVAELVGSPVDTVKSRLLHARRSMREMIHRDTLAASRRRGAGS